MSNVASSTAPGQPAGIAAQYRAARPARVLDLANGPDAPPRGGRDPDVPMVMMPLQVAGRLRVAHTWALSDPDAPIWLDESADVYPGTEFADLRCPQCVTRADIARGGGETVAVLEHQPGCGWLAALAARSPR